jgi:hypothetical protein
MAKVKYYYDTETCRYEKVKASKADITFNILGLLVVSAVLAVGFATFYTKMFPSKEVAQLKVEKQELLTKYQVLDKEISQATDMLSHLQQRDNKLYRSMFEVEPIPMEMRKGGTGGSEKYKHLLDDNLVNETLIVNTHEKLDNLKKQMYIQTKSYDELMKLAQSKNDMMASIPAIQPLSRKDQTSFASGFGMRTHPIYKVRKMHTGCDLSARTGTPVHATGDGVVIKADWSSGYGKLVEVDHGYGYITRYAHLSAFNCKQGQKIKRGQLVGKVGSTGLSVAPHLHYEVRYNGAALNPINYFFNDLSPAEYQQLVEISSHDGQSLGGGSEDEEDHNHIK